MDSSGSEAIEITKLGIQMDKYDGEGAGTITLEYYDGSSDFSDSDEENLTVYNSDSGTASAQSSKSNLPQGEGEGEEDAEFKTYDFQHWSVVKETAEEEDDNGNRKFFSESARNAMNHHYTIIDQEHMESLMHPKGSFPRCPKGDSVDEPYFRRKFPGPFLTCCFSHSHECGDEFYKVPVNTKPMPSGALSYRPHHLKERKAKFFKQCKNCEYNGFAHHRNPAQHYEDYLNNVTYKQHKNHAKVWPQHLADLRYALEDVAEKLDPDYLEMVEKCKDYRPSTVIIHATRFSEKYRKKRQGVIVTRKRTPLPRPSRRPSSRTSNKVSGFTNSPRVRDQRIKEMYSEVRKPTTTPASSARKAKNATASVSTDLSKKLAEKSKEAQSSIQSQSQSIESSSPPPFTFIIKNEGNRRMNRAVEESLKPRTELQRRLKASVTRLIKSRQAQSQLSKRFVKKPKPPKEAKYIQKVKPNISAKFLRARSKGKLRNLSSSITGASVTKKRTKGERREGKSIMKVLKKPNPNFSQPGTVSRSSSSGNSNSYTSNSISPDISSTSENGSFSQFRDQNGEFDTEKYRKSILKMLAKQGGTRAKRDKKKHHKRASPSTHGHSSQTFVSLPKIKNKYSNIKPKTVTNVPQQKRRKSGKKSKSENLLDILSDITVKSKYSNHALEDKDSYFSIPSLDDVKL